jgi:hypothetical protein
MHSLLVFASTAAEGEEPSKTLFYVMGGVLAAWAVLVSSVGIARHATFPPGRGASTLVLLSGFVLVAATMASAVITG